MKLKRVIFSAIFVIVSFYISNVDAKIYNLDKAHSQVAFSVKHLVISNVKGEFTDFSGNFEVDKDDNLISVSVNIVSASIFTRNEKRDKHLKSPDFFDVENYPNLTFKYKKTLSKNGAMYEVLGDLTIRGITKEVTLTMELLGKIKDPWGNYRLGFTGKAEINRKDFGIVWNKILETGGVVVGETVKISIEGEGILKKKKK